MSVQSSEGTTSSPPTNLPEPAVRILEGAAEGRGNLEGLEISDPVDKRLSEAIAQARTLAIDEESVAEFLTASATHPSSYGAPSFVNQAHRFHHWRNHFGHRG